MVQTALPIPVLSPPSPPTTPPTHPPLQGLLLIGPTLHVWYGSLGTIVKATGNTGAIMRLSLDQLCFAPVFISSECRVVAAMFNSVL